MRITREEVAKKIHWNVIVWMIVGPVNMGAMFPQLYQIITTQNVIGVSLEMFVIFFFLQLAFSLQGFFRRDNMLMISMGVCAIVTTIIISLVLCLRS